MTVKNVKHTLTAIAILIIVISFLACHTITVQATIFAITIKFVPSFFFTKSKETSTVKTSG